MTMIIHEIIKYVMDSDKVNDLTFNVIDEDKNELKLSTKEYVQFMYKSLQDKRAAVEEFLKTQVRDNDTEVIWSLERALERLDDYLKQYKDFNNYENPDAVKDILDKSIELYSDLTVVFNSIVPVAHLDSVQ